MHTYICTNRQAQTCTDRHIHVNTDTCMHRHTHTDTDTQIDRQTHGVTHAHTHTTRTHSQAHTCAHTCVRTPAHIHKHTQIYVRTPMHTQTHTCTHTLHDKLVLIVKYILMHCYVWWVSIDMSTWYHHILKQQIYSSLNYLTPDDISTNIMTGVSLSKPHTSKTFAWSAMGQTKG